jgi:hypothetical protein
MIIEGKNANSLNIMSSQEFQNPQKHDTHDIQELKKQLEILQKQLAQLQSQISEITQTTDRIFYRDWSVFYT